MKRREFLKVAAALVAIVALGLRPYLYAVSLWPSSRDAALWILRGMPTNPEWATWVFGSKHFVGYRPVAAVSYSVDYVLGGLAAWPYRLTDLGLHALCGLLVYALYRRLVPNLPNWGGLLASAIFLAHPLVSEVVPHLARRSYSLATAFALAALCVGTFPRPAFGGQRSRQEWLRSIPVGLLLAAAVLSNEIAIMTVPIFVVVTWQMKRGSGEGWREIGIASAIPLAAVAGALLCRVAVVGGFGGYAAVTDRGERMLPIVSAMWQALAGVVPLGESADRSVSPLVAVLAAGAVAYYLWRLLTGFGDSGNSSRASLCMALWLAGATLLFAPLGVWFPRQMYPLLAPFALLVAIVAADAFVRNRGVARIAHLVPPLVTVLWVLAQSPLLHGVEPARIDAWVRTDGLLRAAHDQIGAIAEPAEVRLAVPYYERPEVFALRARGRDGLRPPLAAELPTFWLQGLLAGRNLEVESFLVFADDAGAAAAVASSSRLGDRPAVELDSESSYWLLRPAGDTLIRDGKLLVTPSRNESAEAAYLYFHDGRDGILTREP
jgi:hypothetical protein